MMLLTKKIFKTPLVKQYKFNCSDFFPYSDSLEYELNKGNWMNEEQLMLVERGLSKLARRYRQNLNDGDKRRLKYTLDAKIAIRKVILAVAIKGSLKDISPFIENGHRAGWEVIDKNDRVLRYYA